jgi:hypothetical protein
MLGGLSFVASNSSVAEPLETDDSAGLDVAGGIFADPPSADSTDRPNGAEVGLGIAGAASMLPPAPGSKKSPYDSEQLAHVWDGLRHDDRVSDSGADPNDMFGQPKELPPPQKELANRVIEILKPSLDPFQKAQLALIKRAQSARPTDQLQTEQRMKPHLAEIQREVSKATLEFTKIAKEQERKRALEQAGAKKKAPGIEVASFGFDLEDGKTSAAEQGEAERPADQEPVDGPNSGPAELSEDSSASFIGSIEDNGTGSSSSEAVVSLYINVEPSESVERLLGELIRLKKERRVKVGNIVLVGLADKRAREFITKMTTRDTREPAMTRERRDQAGSNRPSKVKIKIPLEQVLMKKYGLYERGFVKVQPLLRRFDVKHSPCWVVRWKGQDHIFEGRDSIWSMISKDGTFVGPDALADQNSVEASDNSSNDYRSPTTLEDDPTPTVHHEGPGGGPDFKVSRYSEIRFGS